VSGLSVWIFHGNADQNVSVEESRRMAASAASPLIRDALNVHYVVNCVL
jgi:hypothetical protein